MRLMKGLAVVTTIVIASCGGGEPEAVDDRAGSVIGDPLHSAVDRAEAVQDTLDVRAAELRERLEADERD